MKTCSECQTEFEPGSHKGLVCSLDCRNTRRRRLKAAKRPIKSCMFCQQDYKPFRRDQKFCSKSCLQSYYNNKYYNDPAYMARLNNERRERYKIDSDYRSYVMAKWKRSYEKNKIKRLAYRHNYRITHDFDKTRGLIDAETIKAVFARDNYTCQYCGMKNTRMTIDHRIALRISGTNHIDNLCVACKSCNSSKQTKTPQEFAEYKNACTHKVP